ncbi:hypothetical protein DFH09DRAFT_1410578 [Mycena vulgaris]|nr:hypothetical protein DFH09DRAFT_1410578 [Mycena vulgaris]
MASSSIDAVALLSILGRLFRGKSKPTAKSAFSSTQSGPSSSPPIIFFSVLGVAGSLQNKDAGWMILDWMIFTTLLASQPGFDRPRFRYRLLFPVPPCLFDERAQTKEVFDAEDFVNNCFLDIAASSSRVQPGEQFVLLLIGHGKRSQTGDFMLCVSTKSNRMGEAWLTKRQLESAVKKCRGQITVICNSCHSGALKSPRWQLVCVAGPNELAEAFTTSASGNVRGSASSLCALAEVRQEQDHEEFLIYESGNRFRHCGSEESRRPWHEMLPIGLSQWLVDEVTTTPDNRSSDHCSTANRLNEIYHSTGGSSLMVPISSPVDSARHQLHLLAPMFSVIPKSLRRDSRDAERCQRFLHDSRSLAEGEIIDFFASLRNRLVHSVVVQLISRELGWYSSPTVVSFLSLKDAISGEFVVDDMIENGIHFDDLVLRLQAEFEGTRSDGDRASIWWFALVWASKERPKVSPEAWKKAVDTAVKEAGFERDPEQVQNNPESSA